ncbi:GAF and ANTAR domain-containing protein [Nocardioides sp. TF02-7]|uniref:GAF and ANTAR domain-containing protein n=1 Tax=Nocardioides sp. TF02-7 TaxID=2917724 RepID=UPI001F064628|nr:GAF and ANTAR domain-containing protein [Nocardioides sp. TF02-7]UMG94418.1 GAF and ANTAR domain-containing protein [Nocardioides sp. TF02-7]
MDHTHPPFTEALVEAARTINDARTLEETLDAIVHAACTSIPTFDEVGISIVHAKGRVETKAATGPLVRELDGIQYELEEGPCFATLRDQPVVLAEHLPRDDRWPRYVPKAAAAGVRAQLGLRLYLEDETIGGLNLYSTSRDSLGRDALLIAELFAAHAALALGRVRREGQLNDALGTRSLIGTAIGLVMARYQLTEERAFAFLVRASSTSNIKLRDIAAEIVASADEKHRTLQDGRTEPERPGARPT